MKIAFIILCHKNSSQINMLLTELLKCDSDIYVHVDKKNNSLRSEIMSDEHIFLLPESDSYSVEWGGVSIVQATLSLMRAVCNSGIEYGHICLLSGQDFLIRPVADFESLLAENPVMNFIELIPSFEKRYRVYRKRCEIFYPKWINKNDLVVKILKRFYMLFTGGFSHTFSFCKRRKPFEFDFAFGSQWWCLTSNCVKYMMSYVDSHPEYVKFFDKCIVPDECFFQTIFANSTFVRNQDDYLTYVNWGKNRRSPEIFLSNDFNRLKKASEKFFFARKFDIQRDKIIVEMLMDSNGGKSYDL
ncbi:MAG: hypothetical protein IJT42_06050 [Treponema sp.]|nr:hypothetical protein [Treponema sp.]